MNYKKITFGGRSYKYHVGRSNIEIRHDDDGEPLKLIIPRPEKLERWGLITPDVEHGGNRIRIFTDGLDEAKAAYDEAKAGYPDMPLYSGQVELVPLPSKTVSITPGWMRERIEHLVAGMA